MLFPKFNLLYYKALIDKCFIRFFDEYNDLFIKNESTYILANNINKSKIKQLFKNYIFDELKLYIKPYSIIEPNYYFIIGACLPKNNLLLKYKTKYFPNKLSKLIDSEFQIQYFLKEHDIKLDLVKFNQIILDIFQDFFGNQQKIAKILKSNDYSNVFFIRHSKLDCYSMFKLLKYIFGKNNCVNIYKEKFQNIYSPSPIVSINDLIDKYINNKIAMNKSQEFKQIILELKMYIEQLGVLNFNGN